MTVYQAPNSGLETQWLKRQKTCSQSSTQSTGDRPRTTATTKDNRMREVLPEKRAKCRGWNAGKQGLWSLVRKDVQVLQMPYLEGCEDTPVSPSSSFPPTPQGNGNNVLTVPLHAALGCSHWAPESTLFENQGALSPLVSLWGDENMGAEPISACISQLKKL